MAIKDIVNAMVTAHPLDRVPRAGFLLRGVTEPESVAAHSHSLALLVLLVCEEHADEFDASKATKMAVIHDLQEVATMDIPMPAGNARFKAAKDDTEEEIFRELFGAVSPGLAGLYTEFRASESPEARLVRGLDKVQMMIKVHCYESENRGRLDDFWLNKGNFKSFGLPILNDMFRHIAQLAGRVLP